MKAGRPRNPNIDATVLAAARDLVVQEGYERVTVDATAARARTSRAAIYRRFATKAELMFAAAVHRDVPEVQVDTGSIRGDLLALARRIRADMSAPAARAVAPHVVAELARSPELAQRFRETFVATERGEVEAIVERAAQRGELSRRPDVGQVHRLLGGALFFSIFVIGEPIDDDELAGIVDLLVGGLGG